jgi:hypothetical protein
MSYLILHVLSLQVHSIEEHVRASAEHKLGVANQSITAGFFDDNTRWKSILYAWGDTLLFEVLCKVQSIFLLQACAARTWRMV